VVNELTVGAVHKVSQVFSHIGGKGVNVSRTVAALGGQTKVTGLIGQATLDEATRELEAAGLASALFPVARPARQTVTVTAKDGTATAFDEAGPHITEQEWTGFEQHFHNLVQEADMVVIAGSLPPGTPEESLEHLCKEANRHRIPVILDARGAAMRAAQRQAPLVSKLNRGELEQTLDRRLATEQDILEGARELHAQGAQNVVVTFGPDGAIGVNEHGAWRVTHPAASGNPIGAGDAFSAGLALALLESDEPFDEAIRRGAAAALASLRAPTAGALDPDDFRDNLPNVQTQEITKEAAPP
jgi:tagatose 6-phosphate kinase